MKMEDDQYEDLPICPSFSSYSTNKFADIAVNVAKECTNLSVDEDSDLDFSFVCCDDDDDDDDLSIVRGAGEFRQVFPIFNRDLSSDESSINVSLKKLFLDEDEERDPTSSSSSEIDELETIPPESYCVWKPKEAESSTSITCKKSRSTGSGSKRWKLRDLLYRSNSDGKSAFVFLREKPKSVKVEISNPRLIRKLPDGLKKQNQKTVSSPAANNMLLYSRNRAMMKESERRKSYLPYRRDLVGFFTNVNGIGRNFHRY